MRWDGSRYKERWTFRRVKWPSMEAVSYTHLDVYKRQTVFSATEAAQAMVELAKGGLTEADIDVYKRQSAS